MPYTSTSSNKINAPESSNDGYQIGDGTDSYVGFYGSTPIVRPSGAAQTAITDSSGGSADPATGVAALTGTYNSTIIADAIATLAAQGNALRLALVNLGLIQGS